MATVVLSNLAHVSDYEAKFFRELMDTLRDRGHRVFLWSAVPKSVLDDNVLPMRWRIADLERFYPVEDLDAEKVMAEIDGEKWRARIDMLAKQGSRPFPRGRDLEILAAVTQYVIDQLQPDLFLAWNPLCPHFGVAHDLCLARGIPSLLMERAFFPDTWFVEDGGLVGHSQLAGLSLEEMLSGRDGQPFRRLGRDYLESSPFAALDRYAQRKESPIVERLFSGDLSEAHPRIAFFPPDDLSLGFFPVDHEDRRRHLPGFESSFEAAKALAAANPGGTTLFKPHPSFLEWRFEASDSPLVVLNHSYNDLIAWADIVATTGSGLAFSALAAGKPVLEMGRSALTGKGITYEALHVDEVGSAVAAARAGEGASRRRENFESFVGFALAESVVSHPQASRSYLRPAAVAEQLHERFLRGRDHPQMGLREAEVVARIRHTELEESEEGEELETSEPIPLFPTSSSEMDIEQDMRSIGEELRSAPEFEAVVDFDYTLLQSNSTELYLDTVTPQWLGFLIGKAIKSLRLDRLLSRGSDASVAYDQLRVFFVTLLFPWTLLLWRRRAPRLAEQFANRRLIAGLKAGGCEQVTVISNGFRFVIRPLLGKLGIEVKRLIASGPVPGWRNLAAEGKRVALEREVPGIDLRRVLFVTDSVSDAALLAAAGKAYLIKWPCEEFKAYRLTYVPFRYTAEGKYRGEGVVKRHRFGEDLVVILLAYQAFLGGLGWLPLVPEVLLWNLWTFLALFLSFHSVYEIGYYENDFKAALREDRPQVNPAVRAFGDYPIARMGWFWGAALGCLAFVPGLFSSAASTAPDSWLVGLLRTSGEGADSPRALVFLLSIAVWTAVLLATRGIFRIHNRLPVSWRTSSFAVLQGAKLTAFAAFFQLTVLGAALIVAQVMRHLSNYVVYRQSGNRHTFARQLHRLQVFGVLAGLLFLVQPTLVGLEHPQVWMITGWCLVMAAEERYTPRVIGRHWVIPRGVAQDLLRLMSRGD